MLFFSLTSKRHEAKKSTGEKRTFVPRLEILESRDLPSTFTVTNTSSDVNTSNSLPWAIQQSNSTPGLNTIDFNISGSGTHVINLTEIQWISNPVIIDGTSQPGYNGKPLISIQGNSSLTGLFVLTTGSSGSTIEGLDMYNSTVSQISMVAGSNGNLIQDNWIGFYIDPNGQVHLNSALGYSGSDAIGIQSSNNTIRNNVLSGVYNAIGIGEDASVSWSGTVYQGNSITSNFIGTDPDGTTAQGYGNQSSAVYLGAGSQGNLIGPYNVLSGNLHGVEMNTPSTTGNIVFENRIGTDVTGTYAISNGDGVDLSGGANGNTIGGSFGGNLISGNTGVGVNLGVQGYGSGNNNWVQGNIIGLNGSQTVVLGTGNGVSINSGSVGNHVQGNVLCGATFNGVYLQNASSNDISGNWIGESSSGTGFANRQYGVAVTQGSNYNSILGNYFGVNNLGNLYIDATSIGNVTDVSSASPTGPTNPPGSTSISDQIQQIFQAYGVMLQALGNRNIPLFFQEVQNIVSLYVTVELEILRSFLHLQ